MDTQKLIKQCPRCGTPIEPSRSATALDHGIGGVGAVSCGIIGLELGGPIGGIIGAAIGYAAGKSANMSNADIHNSKQWYKYKCPKCGTNWKEKIHTNDNPEPIDHPLNGIP